MDLKKLPWWKNANSFQYLSRDIFYDRIRQVPLNINLATSFLDNWVSKFSLTHTNAFYGRIWQTDCLNHDKWGYGFNHFLIKINANITLEEQAISLVHESMHGIYRAGRGNKIERIVEAVSSKFYEDNKDIFNKDFVKYYLQR